MFNLRCLILGHNMVARPFVSTPLMSSFMQLVFGRECTACGKMTASLGQSRSKEHSFKHVQFVASLKGCVVIPWWIYNGAYRRS